MEDENFRRRRKLENDFVATTTKIERRIKKGK